MKTIIIMGQTAVGKSGVAIEIAKRFGGEIVGADSMQVYKGLTISTAGPNQEMLKSVPHHLYQCIDPTEEWNAVKFARKAGNIIDQIMARNRIPIVVGGTFFWIRALVNGLSEIPEIPGDIRNKVAQDIKELGLKACFEKLAEVDPEITAIIKPSDTQRIARALEVFLATGIPLSQFQKRPPRPILQGKSMKLILTLPRTMLYERINLRVEEMIRNGVVAEIQDFITKYEDAKVLKVGTIAPIVQHIKGELSLEEMKEKLAREHRRYAKRQMTWLRKEKDTVSIDVRNPDEIFSRIEGFLKGED